MGHFKHVNDTLSHRAGDQGFVIVARMIHATPRTKDALPEPAVRFSGGRGEGFRALAVALQATPVVRGRYGMRLRVCPAPDRPRSRCPREPAPLLPTA